MTLDEKIGKLFSVPARSLNDEVIRHVRDNHVGGVIWFQSTMEEAARANRDLQTIAKEPLLISADLEAGLGMRFTDATWWPPSMALAATGDPSLAEEQARVTAIEARAIGIQHILAPVCDVNADPRNPVINTRSFGEDPHEVARYVEAFVRGIESEGAVATAKHFPGHGDTHLDSHRSLPVLGVSRDRLERVELVPFRAAIRAGVGSVMIGHLAVPELDPTPISVRSSFENVWGTEHHEVTQRGTMPATLSKPIIDLLRRDLGFDGLIVSDAFDMGGLAAHFDPGEAAVRALEAGEDQILYSADTDAAIAAVKAAVRSGRLSMSGIEESCERVRRAASKSADRPAATGRPHGITAMDVARRSITLVRDERGLLPLTARNLAVRVFSDQPLDHALEALGAGCAIGGADVILLLLAMRPQSGAGQISVPVEAKRIAEQFPHKTIAVSFGSPYILQELGHVSTFVCAWGIQPVLQVAAMEAIRGAFPMTGKLPVSIESLNTERGRGFAVILSLHSER